MNLVDTHAHLQFSDYDQDRDEVIDRAKAAGVRIILCPGSNITDSAQAIALAQKYPKTVLASAGIHPQPTDPNNTLTIPDQLKKLRLLAKTAPLAAIGECGLDYASVPPGEKERSESQQKELFLGQIELAREKELPLLIHTRQAFPETVALLNRFTDLRGVFHCYSAGKKGLEPVQRLGFYFGFDGNLTYDEGLQRIAATIPLEKILLETDAPFLSPVPHRGERNEPAYLVQTAKTLAKTKKTSLSEIARITTQNVRTLFFSLTS